MTGVILLLFLLVIAVAVQVLLEFIRSKNGILRKIMIAYFAIEILVWTAAVAAYLNHYFSGPEWLWIVVLLPKALLKLALLKYLLNNKTGSKNNRFW
jgi:hypothetical protein